jgi:hypothetical protein
VPTLNSAATAKVAGEKILEVKADVKVVKPRMAAVQTLYIDAR